MSRLIVFAGQFCWNLMLNAASVFSEAVWLHAVGLTSR